jgi:peptide/nickel transport system substrate-binding protein
MKNKNAVLFVLAAMLGLIVLAACAAPEVTPETIEVVKTVIVTEMVEGEVVEVVTTQIVEVEVTPVPVVDEPMAFEDPNPDTYTWVTFGDIDTLDPAWNYESFGDGFLEDIYDNLVAYQGPDANKFSPELATSWELQDGGATYVFNIRDGVTFHEGQELTPSDVAYTFQRSILQGGYSSPMWLYTEAFFGIGVGDIAEMVGDGANGDNPEGLQAEDPAALLAVCEGLQSQIVADDAAGTVTFYLAQPWAPLLSTIAGSWGAIVDQGWAVENGAWDGDCSTWQNYYGVSSENAPLRAVANGTGPYILDHWTPGEEVVMVANENYWRDEPAWEGGPVGAPRLSRVVVQEVSEWGTRFAMLQAGDADSVTVPPANYAQVDPMVGELCEYIDIGQWDCQPTDNPDGPLRLYKGYPLTARTDVFFVFNVNTEGGNNFIGSGELDGNGIPPDFFSDVHVRRAFNYCFDWDAYIADALAGEAVQNYGPINQGLIGYDNNADHFSFDLDKCAEELQLAWDGAVWENGFRFQFGFNTGNVTRQTVGQILQANFGAIDPKFQIEVVGLPWPSFLAGTRNSTIPIFVSGWGEDIHDPHNWAQPFLIGTYAGRQNFPQELYDQFSALVDAGVAGTTDEERATAYLAIQQLDYDQVLGIRLAVSTGRTYVQRWVSSYLINPMLRQPFYYYSK